MSGASFIRRLEPRDTRLKRWVVHDERSRGFALDEPAELPRTPVMHERRIPVLNQGEVGSCTANALLGVLGTGPFAAALIGRGVRIADFDERLALAVYHDETVIDDRLIPGVYPPDDTGSAGIYSMKIARNRGWITGYRHAFSLNATLGALAHGPVSLGIPWYQSMFTPDAHGLLTVDTDSGLAGGHQICADGIDMVRGLVRITNSWGEDWGLIGRAWLSIPDLRGLLKDGGDVSVPVIA